MMKKRKLRPGEFRRKPHEVEPASVLPKDMTIGDYVRDQEHGLCIIIDVRAKNDVCRFCGGWVDPCDGFRTCRPCRDTNLACEYREEETTEHGVRLTLVKAHQSMIGDGAEPTDVGCVFEDAAGAARYLACRTRRLLTACKKRKLYDDEDRDKLMKLLEDTMEHCRNLEDELWQFGSPIGALEALFKEAEVDLE